MLFTFLSIQSRPTNTEKPVYVVHISFRSKTGNLHRDTRLSCPPFYPFKDGQLTQGKPAMLSTFLSIQRRPTYTENLLYFAHI